MSSTHSSLESMNLNLMLALHWLLVEQSVTRAATRVGVTQSAMSRSLANLRDFFDDPLFVTVGRRLEPTVRAAELREPLSDAIGTFRSILGSKTPFDPSSADDVFTILATEHAMGAIVPRFLKKLRSAAPALIVHIECATADAWSLVAQGHCDLLLAPKIGSLQTGLVSETLLFETFVTVLRRANPAARKRLTLARYCELEHVVTYPRGGNQQSLVTRVLAEHGYERRVAVRVPYFSSAIDLVAASDLVLTLPTSLAPKRLSLHQPPIALPGFALEAVWPKRLDTTDFHSWVRGILRQSLA